MAYGCEALQEEEEEEEVSLLICNRSLTYVEPEPCASEINNINDGVFFLFERSLRGLFAFSFDTLPLCIKFFEVVSKSADDWTLV
jgi:hypothetical protein